MKLSKQEQIAAMVIVALIIVAAGVFLFIKPNIETIGATQASLEAKKAEYEEDVTKVQQKDALRTQVLEAYDKGKNLADMFFPELSAYEADNEFRAFLEERESNPDHAKVVIDDLTVSAAGTTELGTSMFIPSEVQYALKEYVNQGSTVDITTIDPNLIRQTAITLLLGEPQTIGATTVKFTLKTTTIDDILKFADEVNNYETKDENGNTIRKAISLDGISFTDLKTKDEYNKLANELKAQAEAAGYSAFRRNTGTSLNQTATPSSTPEEDEEGGEASESNTGSGEKLDYHYYEMPCTITFYSIERMQDPTEMLNEQDAAVQ